MSGSRKYPTEVFLIDESIDPEEFIIERNARIPLSLLGG